jgi:hypothetical protein
MNAERIEVLGLMDDLIRASAQKDAADFRECDSPYTAELRHARADVAELIVAAGNVVYSSRGMEESPVGKRLIAAIARVRGDA